MSRQQRLKAIVPKGTIKPIHPNDIRQQRIRQSVVAALMKGYYTPDEAELLTGESSDKLIVDMIRESLPDKEKNAAEVRAAGAEDILQMLRNDLYSEWLNETGIDSISNQVNAMMIERYQKYTGAAYVAPQSFEDHLFRLYRFIKAGEEFDYLESIEDLEIMRQTYEFESAEYKREVINRSVDAWRWWRNIGYAAFVNARVS